MEKKENIAEAYSIVANRDSISMENNAGVKEDTINWTKKSDADGSSSFTNTGAAGDGQYTFGSWGNDVNRNSDSKSDIVGMANADNNEGKREIAISEAALYSYKTSLYGATNVGSGIEIHFSLRAGQSEEKILDDLNSSVFENREIITPVKMESSDTTKKIYVSGSDWDSISFFTQRDILGREYDKIDETISTGNSVKMTASGKYFIELKKGDKTYEMSSGVSADTYEDKLRTTLDTLKSDLFSKHNNQVSNERSRLWKNWCNDSSQNHYATLKNYKVPGEGDDIVTKYAKEKLNIADWNSKTDAEKETQLSSILSSDASARNYFMSELYKCGPCDNIDDTVLGFTLTEKKSMYNTLKDGYPDKYLGDVSEEFGLDIDGRGFAKSYDVKMTGIQNSHESSADTITLTFDTSNIKLSDYLKYDTNFLDYDYNKSLLTPGETMSDLVAIKDLAETTSAKSLLDYEFTNVTFDFKSDGMSYQKVELKHGNNTGTKAINFAQSYSKFELPIQDGTAKGQHIDINYKNMRTTTLGLRGTTLSTEEDSRRMMDIVGIAQETVSSERSQFGAYINRLEHSFNNNKNTAENLQNAESLIRDTDMAKEMVNYTKQNILEQVAQSIMAQANQQTQGVLSILQ